MKIKIKNQYYFERGTMSLTPRQKKALEANKKLVAVDKTTGATFPVNNVLALSSLVRRVDEFNGDVYFTARFK